MKQRILMPELMDSPDIDPVDHQHALQGLARINRLSGSARMLWSPLAQLAKELGREIKILDVATGAGDLPVQLADRAERTGLRLIIDACDISETAIGHARTAAAGRPITFFQHDVIAEPLPVGYDVVICSLFLHHLEREDAVLLLRRMAEATGRLVLVNDLERGRLNWNLVWLTTRLLTRSHVVHVDGPLSVAAAWTVAEAQQLAVEAGMGSAVVKKKWPCRFLLQWQKAVSEEVN